MLSLKKGELPIAQINSGKFDKQILYLNSKIDESNKIEDDPLKFLHQDMFTENRRTLKSNDINKIYQAIQNGSDMNLDPRLQSFYNKSKLVVDKKINREFILDDGGHLQMIPNIKTRDVIFASGASGSGKSYFIGNYITQYMKMFPKNPVYIFSKLESDQALDKNKGIQRIILDDTFGDEDSEAIEAKDMSNCLAVFDDVDTINDPIILKKIIKLRDDLLEVGRKFNVYMCMTSHMLCDYRKTRILLNECTHNVCFKNSNTNHQKRFMKEYVGMSKDDIDKALSLPSRWICISKAFPSYLLYDTGCYLLS